MAFKDEIDAAGERYWKSAYEDRTTDILDACVDKIDELEGDLDNLRAAISHADERADKTAELVTSLHYQFGQCLGELSNLKEQQDPPELIPGLSQDVLNDMVEVFKVTVAKKKQELEKAE